MGTSAQMQPRSKPTWLKVPLVPEEVTFITIRRRGMEKRAWRLKNRVGSMGTPDQVVHGAQLVRGEAQVLRNGPVLGAAGHVEGAAVRRRLEKELVCAGQVIGPAVPEQALPAEHRGTSSPRSALYSTPR